MTRVRSTAQALFVVGVCVVVAALGLATASGARKPHPKFTATAAFVPIEYTVTIPDGAYGTQVDATVSPTPLDATDPWETLWLRSRCYQLDQAGTPDRVYIETLAINSGRATLTLGPTNSWTGGDADCIADVGHFVVAATGLPELFVEGSTTFHVIG